MQSLKNINIKLRKLTNGVVLIWWVEGGGWWLVVGGG
jgi:hypothetical protein